MTENGALQNTSINYIFLQRLSIKKGISGYMKQHITQGYMTQPYLKNTHVWSF